MKLKITTLVIVEEGQVQDIYHSLEDDQDKAYQEMKTILLIPVILYTWLSLRYTIK